VNKYRKASPSDAPSIVDFQMRMARETERLELDRSTVEHGVHSVFEQPHRGTYHVCEVDGRVVGSLMIITEWSDWRNGEVWWIHSVFIEPEFRGRGLFAGMYEYIKQAVQAEPKLRGLRLYVDRSNTSAQAVYQKLGMNGEHYRLFEWMKTF